MCIHFVATPCIKYYDFNTVFPPKMSTLLALSVLICIALIFIIF